MWNAFGNGSGLHGGGGGGGYVTAQGWEFVPCARLERERGRGKTCSPLRRVSSPPTVGQFFEQLQPGVGTSVEAAREQVRGLEPPTHQTRLKKKFEDLRKRHGQDKEEWTREKEILLRQVADIQGGENRRILLDLKSVLEEVQGEVKKEEEKRSELQLQYTKDRCSWELEKAELKCRIAQLEARESSGAAAVVRVGGVGAQGARGGGAGPSETLQRDREEQRRLLADTHTAAMDLRCRLELSERGWLKERSELLERFDSERREWEGQLRDMQSKIEELYSEVRSRNKGGEEPVRDGPRFSLHSTSTGSSWLSGRSASDAPSSSCQSDAPKHSDPGNAGNSRGRSPGRRGNDPAHPFPGVAVARSNRLEWAEQVDQEEEEESAGKQEIDTDELEAILRGVMGQGFERDAIGQENVKARAPVSRGQSTDSSYGSEKKRNTTALNAALREIARVSEELCSYQEEIRKKAEDERNKTEIGYPSEDLQKDGDRVRTRLEKDEMTYDFKQLYTDLRVLEEENWITWSASSNNLNSWSSNSKDSNIRSPGQEKEAPPIPPRTTSWYLSSPTPPEQEAQAQESLSFRKCHSPCIVVDRKSNSPSIVRKFEAMLQENEGKILTEVGVASCSVPTNSKCNMGCCHNRWSCDGSRFGSSKSSTYVPVHKSLSEMNILTAGRDNRLDHRPPDSPKTSEGHRLPMGKHAPDGGLSWDLPSLSLPSVFSSAQGSQRNITLEQKTAEFNRTLFQAEMGRGVDEEDLTPAGVDVACETVCLTVGAEVPPQDAIVDLRHQSTEVKHIRGVPNILTVPSPRQAPFSLPSHHPQVKLRRPSLDQRGPEVEVRDVTSDGAIPNTSSHHLSVGASTSPSWNTTGKEKEPVSLQAHPVSASPKQRKPQGESLHPADAPENTPWQARRGAHPDTSRPGPRVLNDHPWKPLTLAAYPRPADSRSNYGAVERILKSYESAAWAQQYQQSQPSLIQGPRPGPGPGPGPGPSQGEGDFIELLDMLEMDNPSLSPAQRNVQTHSQINSHTHRTQMTSHTETLTVQENQETSSSESVQKNFSRPARPANRRLPSRWASRSPSSSSSTSSSPSTTPVTQPSVSAQRHTFSYSAYHTETVIM